MFERFKKKNADKNQNENLKEFQKIQKKYIELYAKKLATAIIYDPTRSSTRTTKTYQATYTQEQLYSYLQNPSQNEKNLRDASDYMYNINTRYYRLIQYYAGIPTYAYVISPLKFDGGEVDKDKFKSQYMKAVSKIELMNIRDETRKQINIALRRGAFYGVRWSDSSSSFIQQLNPDICQITSISDGVFLFDVDMSKIREENLDCYPPEFTEMYNKYRNEGQKWQPVNPDISVCIKADASILEYSLPPFSGVLPLLYVINDAQSLQEAANEIDNYKLIAGQVPLDSAGVPTMSYEDVEKYYRQVGANIGDRVGVTITPFKFDSFDFAKSATADSIDITSQAVSNFWSSCGTSALLHGAENNTAGVAKLAIKSDETLVFALLDQCERQINRYLKTSLTGTIKFKISFLKTSVFNQEEMVHQYKEAMNYGIGKSQYMAALDIPQYDIEGLSYIENEILNINDILTPLKTASTQSSSDTDAGRPVSSDTDLGTSGEVTRDNDSNANR